MDITYVAGLPAKKTFDVDVSVRDTRGVEWEVFKFDSFLAAQTKFLKHYWL